MTPRLASRFFCLLAFCGMDILHAAIVADITTPIPQNGNTQYYYDNGYLWIRDGYHRQSANIAEIPLTKSGATFPPGVYHVYLRLCDLEANAPLELAINDELKVISSRGVAEDELGPITFIARTPFSTLDIRASQNVRIKSVRLTDSPDPTLKAKPPAEPTQKNAVWIKWTSAEKYPYWFQAKAPINLAYLSAGQGTAEITATIYDYAHRETVASSANITLGTSGTFRLPEVKKFGSYLVKFDIVCSDGQRIVLQKIFAVVSPNLKKPTLSVGGHGNSELLMALGAGRERLWDCSGVLRWASIEPEKGKFNWKGQLPPAPLKLVAVLDAVPAWAPDVGTDPSPYYHYVDQVTRKYQGKVEIYEIFNEMYSAHRSLGAEKYAALVGKTAEIIRKNDPSAKVATGGPPEEIADSQGWWDAMTNSELFNHVDIITAHLYVGAGGTCPLDQDRHFDAFVTSLKALLKSHGYGDKELIDSESGLCPMETFYEGTPPAYGLWGGRGFSARDPVPYLVGTPMYARLLLLHLYHKIPWMIYHTTNSYGNSWSLVDYDNTPVPAAVAIAQTMRLLAGAEPFGRPELPAGFFGVSFKKQGQVIAGIWAVGQKMGETRLVSSQVQSQVRILDMFGNPLPAAAEFEVGINPVYVTGPEAGVTAFLKSLKTRSTFEKGAVNSVRFDRVLCQKGSHGFKVTAPPSAPGYSIDQVFDGETLSSGEAATAWMPAAAPGQETTVLYEWDTPQAVNWITAGWAMGYRPEKYRVEWFDGSRWVLAPGTPNGWRTPSDNVESYPVQEFKTKKLRFSSVPRAGVPTRVSEYAAFYAPRLTPPISEMQEVYNADFAPDKNGFINDWLLCGPFPAAGNRYTSKKPSLWDEPLLKNHEHYGTQYDDATIRPAVDLQHFVNFEENPQTKWRVGRATINWFPYHAKDGQVDLGEAFQKSEVFPSHKTIEQCYGYAVCYVTVKNDFDGLLSIGSDDGYRVWIDGQIVAQKIVFRGASPDLEKYPVTLKKGEHRLLLKIHNDLNGHEFYLRFLDKHGVSFRDFTVRIVP